MSMDFKSDTRAPQALSKTTKAPREQPARHARGLTVWLTGLSGAGKTTIANAVCAELLAHGFRVESLDGDVVRKNLCGDLGYSKEDRNENIRRIGFVAELLTRNGTIVLVSAISPYRQLREEIRAKITDYLEVYVNTPLEICEQRDPKGLYKKARAGEIRCFTGIDDPYEEPLAPEIECNTVRENLTVCTNKIVAAVLAYFSSAPCPPVTGDFIKLNPAAGPESRHDSPVHLEKQLTIAVDFDGVLAEYDGWQGCEVLGAPRPDVIQVLRILRDEGWKIIIHTTRDARHITDYLRSHCIPYDEINQNSSYTNGGPKPVATVYWDDRALRYSGNALRDLESIRQLRTWNGRR
jgi:adenylylsulfate kinase